MKDFEVLSVSNLVSCIENTYKSDFVFPGEQHKIWEFVYVKDGCLEVVKDGRVYILESGQMTFYASNVFHGIRSAKGTSPHIIIIAFDLEDTNCEKLGRGVFNLNEKEDALITDAVINYKNYKKTDNKIKLQTATLKLEELMLSLLDNYAPQLIPQKNAGSLNYRIIIKTMEEYAYNNLCADEIAKLCGMSLSNVKKTFKRYSGIGLMNYYNTIRMAKAKSLIEQGKSMNEISQMLNFTNQYYFTVTFKRHTNMTPTEYKKKILEEKGTVKKVLKTDEDLNC